MQKSSEWILFLITSIWGTTFLASQEVLLTWPPYWLMTIRFGTATIALLPFVWGYRFDLKTIGRGGILGFLTFLGFTLQNYSLLFSSSAHTAFTTSIVTILVPLISAICGWAKWRFGTTLSVIASITGLVLLVSHTPHDATSWPNMLFGDLLGVISALPFAMHIILLGRWAKDIQPVSIAATEIGVTFILSSIAVIAEGSGALVLNALNNSESSPQTWLLATYLGVIATACCLVAQAYGQAHTTATRAAFIYALEPIFAAAFAWLILSQTLSLQEIIGGCLVVLAALLADRKLPKKLRLKNG